MLIIRNLNLISIQSWTYLIASSTSKELFLDEMKLQKNGELTLFS